jgi:hypothetical protein
MDYNLYQLNDNTSPIIVFISKDETDVCLCRLEY